MKDNTVARTFNVADDQDFIRNDTHGDKWLKAIEIDTASSVSYITQPLSRLTDNLTGLPRDPQT